MSRAETIYPLKNKIEKEISKIRADVNSEILTRYYRVRSGQAALATIFNELNRLRLMSIILGKKFEDATIQDMENMVFEVDRRCKSPSTANRYWKILKKFYQWMRGYSHGEYPPEVKWIKMKKVPLVAVTEKDLIPYDECIRITEFASNLRDKALFQCKLDAGCRMGEILTVRMDEIEFNDSGAVLQSDGKTGKSPLILTWSARILAAWINIHPFRHDPSAPLWPLLDREKPAQMSYAAAYRAFKKCVKKSGCKKRVWPHLFKHVSSSYDSEIGLPESYRKFKHHWTPSSKMTGVYEHLSSSIIPKIQMQTLKLMGQPAGKNETVTTQNEIELSKKCRRCNFENQRDSMYCNRCGFSLDVIQATGDVILKSKIDILNKLLDDPEKLEKILEFVK